jgi:hypothetical protein
MGRVPTAYFTSLEAFDGHRSNFKCLQTEDVPVVELIGSCKIGHPDTPEIGIALWEYERAKRVRDYYGAENGRETASTERKTASMT